MRDASPVVVTGIGVVSALGSLSAFWSRLQRGESGVSAIKGFERGSEPPRTAAQVSDWDPRAYIAPTAIRRMDRLSQMFVTASWLALADAKLVLSPNQAEHAGIVLGTALGNIAETETFLRGVVAKGPGRANPLTFPNLVLNAPSGYLAIELSIRGPSYTVCQGDASGEAALALAYDMVAAGQSDLVLAGGGDELSPVLFQIQKDLRLLSPLAGAKRNGVPAIEGSRPFSRTRNGLVMGEGAAMFVLEPADKAVARGARIYAEFAGHSTEVFPSSPHGWPTPSPVASDRQQGQLRALGWSRDANEPEAGRERSMDLIVSAANSSPGLDAFEVARISALLGEGRPAARTLVTSVKGALGEFGGAGALGAAAATLAVHTGAVPRLGSTVGSEDAAGLRLATSSEPDPSGGFGHALVSAAPRGGACMTLLFRALDRRTTGPASVR